MSGCIFCGTSPQTKTHVFRKAWVDRIMVPAPGPFEMIQGSSDLTGQSRESTWEVKEFGMAPGAACDLCNSGWMDQIDRAAERIIEPMVIGQRATIRRYIDQKAVARWVSQVAILIDQTQIIQVVPEEITKTYGETHEPIPGIRIWLARSSAEWSIETWERAWVIATGAPPEFSDRPNMSLFTFRIVNLVVQALVPLDTATVSGFVVSRGEGMRFLSQLWPSRYTPVAWPPKVAIRGDTLDAFARSFEPPGIEPGEQWTAGGPA